MTKFFIYSFLIFDADLDILLTASAKILECEGASHHPAFMGNCQTISHTFSLIYPVDEGNEV